MNKNIILLIIILNFNFAKPIIPDQYKGPLGFAAFHLMVISILKNLPDKNIEKSRKLVCYPLLSGLTFLSAGLRFTNLNYTDYPELFPKGNAFKYISLTHGSLMALYGLVFAKKSYDLLKNK